MSWELCNGMKADDAQSTVIKALGHANLPKGNRPRLLSDNGSSYIAQSFKEFLDSERITPVHGRPMHPQTQGKIERYNRSLKNRILLENYYSPEELERAIDAFVHHYNYHRYHESIDNLTPAQVYYGKGAAVLKARKRTKICTIRERRAAHQRRRLQKTVQKE